METEAKFEKMGENTGGMSAEDAKTRKQEPQE